MSASCRVLLPACLWLLGFSSVWSAPPPERLPLFRADQPFGQMDVDFYPLGWSKDGERLAFLNAYPNEASDERYWLFQIYDLVNDEALVSEEFRFWDEPEEYIAKFWAEHGPAIEAQLTEQEIVRSEFVLHTFPAVFGRYLDEYYQVDLRTESAEDPDWKLPAIRSTWLTVSNGEREKKVFEKSWDRWYPLAIGVIGYLPNPQKDRIAILVGSVKVGFERAPFPRHLEAVVGVRIGKKF